MFPDASAPKSPRTIWIARAIAVAADILQIAVFPASVEGFLSPLSDGIDIVVCLVLTFLLGWHIVFLPTFIIKSLPFADLAPTWTIAVLIVTRPASTKSDSTTQQVPQLPEKKS
jgi:hypothetical protein